MLGAWLKTRLSGERMRAEWPVLLEGGWERLRSERLGDLFPPGQVEALCLRYLTKEKVVDVLRPIVRAGIIPVLRGIRSDHAKVGRWVPPEARDAMAALTSRVGLVDPAWIHSIFGERVVEAILADTLYAALRDFSAIIPRLLRDLTPLGRLAKLGGFGDKGGMGARLLDELERRLEPEIRRFLEKGTRRALDGAARFAVDHLDDPASLEFRGNMLTFVLEREGAFHARALTDEVLVELDRIVELTARFAVERDEAKELLRIIISRIHRRYGDRTLGGVLEGLGVTEGSPFDAWAAHLWPSVQAVLDSSASGEWFVRLATEILEQVRLEETGGSA